MATPSLTLGSVVPSLIRTYVPVLVGQVLSWLVVWGVIADGTITADQQAALSAALGAVLTGAYYTAVRLAERRWPSVGILLGSTRQPVDYAEGHDVVQGEVVATTGTQARGDAEVAAYRGEHREG